MAETEYRVQYCAFCVSVILGASVAVPIFSAQASEPLTQKQKVFALINKIQNKYQKFEQTPQALNQEVAARLVTTGSAPDLSIAAPTLMVAEGSENDESFSRYEVGEELIFSLQLADIPVNDLTLLKTETGYAIDLVMLLEVLNIYFDYQQQSSIVKGWIYDEQNNFSIQLPKKTDDITEVFISNRRYELTSTQYVLVDDISYIDLLLLEQWLGFKFNVRENDLKLFLTTQKPLPLQLQQQRQRNKLQNTVSQSAVLPLKESGYKTFMTPMLDLNLSSGVSVSGSNNYIPFNYSAVGALDVPYFSSLFYFSGAKEQLLNNPRLTLSKYSNKSDLLGPLGLTTIDLGDVTSVNSLPGGSSAQGLGFRLSSLSATQTGNDSKVNFSGVIQNGWDVELYRNNILIDRKLNAQDGRYDFNDVQLFYGQNNFDLVFYGPQGQIETKTEQYNFTENSLKKNDTSYLLSFVDNSRSLFDKQGLAEEEQGYLTNAIFRYGLTDFWTTSVGVESFKPKLSDQTKLNSYSLGNSFNLFNKALFSYNLLQDELKNRTDGYALGTSVLGISMEANYSEADIVAVREQQSTLDGKPSSYGFTASGGFGSSIPLSFSQSWSVTKDGLGNENSSLSNRLALRTPIGVFNNVIQKNDRERILDSDSPLLTDADRQLLSIGNTDPLTTANNISVGTVAGQFNFNTALKGVFLGIGSTYSLQPKKQLEAVSANVSYQHTPDFGSTLGLNYSRFNDQLGGSLGLNWRHKLATISSYFNYNNKDSYSIGLSAQFSFGYEPETKTVFGGAQPLAFGGAMAVKVYEDLNNNKIHDKYEPVVPNAKVKAVQQYRDEVTDERGVAVLKGLSTGYATDIIVDRSSLEDPTMVPTTTGISVLPRRGLVMHHEIPLSTTGEIEGNIFSKDALGEEVPASNILVILLDNKGNKVTETVTEFDGYYAFADVLPGRYKIALNKKYTNRKKLRNATPLLTKVRGGGELIDGRSFILEKMEFTEGFSVVLGSFSSIELLKTYWGVIRPKLDVSLLAPFYLVDEETGRYVLYGHFVQQQEKAERICTRFVARKLSCSVKPLGLDL
jgi:hypothetical protein